MRSVDVVIVFGVWYGEETSSNPLEVLVFEDRKDTIQYLEVERGARTTNGAYWDTPARYGMSLRCWLRTATVKEGSS